MSTLLDLLIKERYRAADVSRATAPEPRISSLQGGQTPSEVGPAGRSSRAKSRPSSASRENSEQENEERNDDGNRFTLDL